MVPYLVVPVALALKSLLVAGVATVGVVVLTRLYFSHIRSWMRQRQHLIQEDPNRTAVGMQTLLKNGQYRTCYGIFDPRTDRLLDREIVDSREMDDEMRRMHVLDEPTRYL